MTTTGPASRAPARGKPRRPEQRVPAERDPIARVVVDVPLAHLDRPFDYVVPSTLDGSVAAGTRVRVRFAGQLVDAVVLDRVATTDHDGRLAFVERAVSAEPVLSPELARLARAVADRWAGSLIDVLRLALPPRHARVEAEPAREPAPTREPVPSPEARRPPAGTRTRPARRSSAPSSTAGRRARSGPRCPARTGRPGSPRRPPRRSPAAAAR